MGVPFTQVTSRFLRECGTPTVRAVLSAALGASVVWVVVFWRLGAFSLLDRKSVV